MPTIEHVEQLVGKTLPSALKSLLRSTDGDEFDLPDDGYMRLYGLAQLIAMNDPNDPDGLRSLLPEGVIVGDDGSRELIVLDMRHEPAPVVLIDPTNASWSAALLQAPTFGQFMTTVKITGLKWEEGYQ